MGPKALSPLASSLASDLFAFGLVTSAAVAPIQVAVPSPGKRGRPRGVVNVKSGARSPYT